jgi:hypothetical protein
MRRNDQGRAREQSIPGAYQEWRKTGLSSPAARVHRQQLTVNQFLLNERVPQGRSQIAAE